MIGPVRAASPPTMRMRLLRPLLALPLLTAVLSAAGAAPAHADAGPGEHWWRPYVDEVAEGLRTSPLYIGDEGYLPLDEEREAEVERTLEESGLPVYLIVISPELDHGDYTDPETGEPVPGADFTAEATAFLEAVWAEMPDPEGHFIVQANTARVGIDHVTSAEGGGLSRAALAVGTLENEARTCVDQVMRLRDDAVERMAEVAVSDDPLAEYEASKEEPADLGALCAGEEPEDGGGGGSDAPPLALLLSAPAMIALVLAGTGVEKALKRRAARRPSPRAVAANAGKALVRELRRRAAKRLPEVGHALAGARADPEAPGSVEALQRALDAHAAARTVHEDPGDRDTAPADAAGVLVLLDLAEHEKAVAEALAAGEEPPARPRHCYANPVHGTRTSPHDWREPGPSGSAPPRIRVPLCAECAADLDGNRPPASLLIRRRGSAHPYYHLPAAENLWSATGYGAFADDLVTRIHRGEHRTGGS
ncbi:hypothetical protein [Nocardiopsis potens]|uniref:hypothetical protein n=1 Tax=Nocardiopsis potens TaxID=1246458 RepID=UPI000349E88B|nr:hypothetical protein [Nocardiopsis potens]